ncbi:MarR family winged helix-turn-helix transcriptional regulator [Actinotalea sp. JY-7876]|uniref:MarR family winged helix-turn-helix transcriptional regulator n=1 Tax=Actinotalea sp. JY-7876 TaxID=2758442 RepID=UPI0015F3CE24|nr:MarR family transcriptional regulator [Actinotalea sp. JY-7876]
MPTDSREGPEAVARAWERELPGAPTRSVATTWLTKAVAAELRKGREAVLRDLGIDAATLDLLSTLRRAGEPYVLTTRQLADRCLVSAGAISQRVARAELDGHVTRRAAPGRRVEVALTDAGHRLVERSASQVLAVDDLLSAGLSDAELNQLESLLGRWLGTMRGVAQDGRHGPGRRTETGSPPA